MIQILLLLLFCLKHLGKVRKHLPIWDENLPFSCVSKCGRTDQHRTEPVIVVRIAIRAIESEAACVRTIPNITTAFEERIVQRRKVRVVQFDP